jgi:hypothetical protein
MPAALRIFLWMGCGLITLLMWRGITWLTLRVLGLAP